MHVEFDGLVRMEMAYLLCILVTKRKHFTLAQLNDAIKRFPWPKGHRMPAIDPKVVEGAKGGECAKVGRAPLQQRLPDGAFCTGKVCCAHSCRLRALHELFVPLHVLLAPGCSRSAQPGSTGSSTASTFPSSPSTWSRARSWVRSRY